MERGQRKRGKTLDEGVFDHLTPESAYWMGWLFTDGSVSPGRDGAP